MKKLVKYLILVYLVGCGSQSGLEDSVRLSTDDSDGQSSTTGGASSSNATTLEISIDKTNLLRGETATVSVSGGSEPYAFSIESGSGAIDSSSGLFTANAGVGSIVLKATDSNGNSKTINVTVACASVGTGLSVSEAYSNASLWMDYIENNETEFYLAKDASGALRTGEACNGDGTIDHGSRNGETTAYYRTCIHAGEIRRVVSTQTSCDGLTASDTLEAFDWTCNLESGVAVFYSRLKESKGLQDLLDSTSFKSNKITISDTYCPLEESSSTVWFSNVVRSLDSLSFGFTAGATVVSGAIAADNGSDGTTDVYQLNEANTIYTISTSKNLEGFVIKDKTALVVLPGATVTYQNGGQNNCHDWNRNLGIDRECVIGLRGNYSWLEGSFDLANNAGGASIDTINNFLMVRNLTVLNPNNIYAIENFRTHRSQFINIEIDDNATGDGADAGMYSHQGSGCYYANLKISNLNGGGIRPNDTDYSIYNKVEISNLGDSAFISGGGYNKYFDFTIRNSQANGIYSNGSSNNVYHDIKIYNSAGDGIGFNNTVDNTPWTRILIVNTNSSGFYSFRSDNSSIQFASFINAGTHGLRFNQESDSNKFSHILSAGNSGAGINLTRANTNEFKNLVLAKNGSFALDGSSDSANNNFLGNFFIGENNDPADNDDECNIVTNTSNTFDVGTHGCTHPSNPNLTVTTIDLSSTFVGRVESDTGNQHFINSDVNGQAEIAYDSITDFSNFNNKLRAFGLASTTQASDATNAGYCKSGDTCAAWDWRLRESDTAIRNINGEFTQDTTCPASVHGDITVSDTNANGANTYLLNAYEIVMDDIGDDDGLCESNEACIYAPNIGYYQGEGELGSCDFDDGIVGPGGSTTVTDVTMYGYLTNGVNF